jgi:hypothetical protein
VHQFTTEGEHVVTLCVSDDSNMVSLLFSGTITINWDPVERSLRGTGTSEMATPRIFPHPRIPT